MDLHNINETAQHTAATGRASTDAPQSVEREEQLRWTQRQPDRRQRLSGIAAQVCLRRAHATPALAVLMERTRT